MLTHAVTFAIVTGLLLALPVAVGAQGYDGPVVWPNDVSSANSDPWLIQNHSHIERMEPRVLVLNFANGYDAEAAQGIVDKLVSAVAESSRYHGYKDEEAPVFLQYHVVDIVDLRDDPMPEGREKKNSVHWPRDPGARGRVDYSLFFTDEMAELIGIEGGGGPASLAEMIEAGTINELWFIGSHNEEDAAFEAVELKQVYDEDLQPVPGEYRQAGNGGDDRQPWLGRSFRIVWINPDRGTGCVMENMCHSMEGMSTSGVIPYLTRYFEEYAGFDLDERYGVPFDRFYACPYGGDELPITWLSRTSLEATVAGETHLIEDYIPAGGNVHFPPGARGHYDLHSPQVVLSTIENFRLRNGPDGEDLAGEWSAERYDRYADAAPDCMGPWLIYWRQNMPGLASGALADDGEPMLNWWPFLYY